MSYLLNYLPFSVPITISAISLSIVPLLILHFRSYLSPSPRPSPNSLPSSFYPAVTSHGRHLPLTAKNAFSYAVLYLGVDVDSMESGRLNLPFRIFRYAGHPLTKLIGLRTKDYLSHGDESFREKLERLLCQDKYGIEKEDIGKIWLVTLPSLAGWEGPNPLTTWYIYKKSKEEGKVGEMLCVILEVHSSFAESHCYVLKPDSEYRQEPAKGYDLAFKFPRQFHVSPFNSRDGFYRADLTNPFPNPDLAYYTDNPPRFKIFLKVLSTDDQVKFIATLTSGPTPPVRLEPWNILSILSTLLKWPFTLFSVTARTFYQAYKLHYIKKLALFPRPEHHTEGSEGLVNPPEKAVPDIGQGMQRQAISWTEIHARRVVENWVKQRVEYTGIQMEIRRKNGREDLIVDWKEKTTSNGNGHANGHSNGYSNGHSHNRLIITTSDPLFFTNLLVSPTPQHSLIMFPEQLTSVSSPEKFVEFFSPSSASTESHIDGVTRYTRNRRTEYFLYLYSHSIVPALPSIPPITPSPSHFIEHVDSSLRDRLLVARIVFWFTFNEYFEYRLFDLLNAKFVSGSEPWKIWERSLQSQFWGIKPQQGREEEKKLGTYFIS
ncbi:hypothetical protein I203_100173 [Kwoniella mangroviensis CBS 8507]|uniref:uncharacterized protein n=1 Tax=Kwoniella mangroviensis CBS 8507 TaxID=1296122 RepID=UPI00080D11E6|nr:uncharacterized protein I203_08078 [Kwoniella mangroviensis CBS 8507]OCF62854.1 hypothetical protein I203_08078 [Kwoniella mangroviensis CBS 8507]